jgi:hypothetical protein
MIEMENAAIPLLNLTILGAFMLVAFRELGNVSGEAIKVREENNDR